MADNVQQRVRTSQTNKRNEDLENYIVSNFSSGHRKREKSLCRQKLFGPYLLDLSIQTSLHFILKHRGFLKCTLATCNQTQKNTGTVMSLPIRILK